MVRPMLRHLVAVVALACSGCGIKGPLVLPPATPPAATPPATTLPVEPGSPPPAEKKP
ncbi:MAG: sugar transporter [Burkholderiales bacterium]|nr:sugar transporter [Burkholderiales bacterium]